MPHLKERITCLAAIDNLVEGIAFSALLVDTLKPGSILHGIYPRLITGCTGVFVVFRRLKGKDIITLCP
jgi:hypothetical protein